MVAMTLTGCKGSTDATNPADGTAAANDPNAQDPSQANMAPVDQTATQGTTQVAGYSQQAQPTQQSYSAPAPVERRAPSSSSYEGASEPGYQDNYAENNDDYDAETGYNATLDAMSAPEPPPPLPAYEQPEAPGPNYIWTPGYWSYTPQGYYWVPGAWTQPPYTGALWTPGYWGGYGSGYRFHHGFWAPHIGFYGGINYGFGYVGFGYQGGYWNGPTFYYNQYANHINTNVVHNVYQRNVVINNTVISNRVVNNTTVNNVTINNVSYNGGRGGVQVKPRPAELAVLREQRVPPMQAQLQVRQEAAQNRQQFFAQNHGRPAMAAAVQPLRADHGIVAPAHTTAQINRALPVAQQIHQEQQFARPVVRPTVPANQAARPGVMPNQPNHGVQPAQPGRPNQTVAQPQSRPMQPENRPTQQVNRPSPQVPARNVPQPVRPQEQPRVVPQQQHPMPQQHPAPQVARPQPQTVRPQPAERPQPAARPTQPVRSQPESRPAPQPHPAPRPQAQPRPQGEHPPAQHPEPHNEPHGR